jgi:uncharacterized protein YecE (DUF72 family)
VIAIGTSGFDYDEWRGAFYPADLPKAKFLEFYADHFRALELNFSYYRMPNAKQLDSMLRRTGGAVTFAIKAHRSMTHERTAGEGDLAAFVEALAPLREAGALGAVLAQFPQSFHQTEENRGYLKRLVDKVGPPFVVELRRAEWASPQILDWLERIGAGFCCVDEPELPGLMPPFAAATASPGYVRFHGRNASKWYVHDRAEERYDYRYDDRELAAWAPKILELERKAGDVLVFFNNHFQGKAVDGAKALERLLNRTASGPPRRARP